MDFDNLLRLIMLILLIIYIIYNLHNNTEQQYYKIKNNSKEQYYKLKNIYYINLESRIDRKKFIKKELKDLSWKYKRFNAIKHKYGAIGCTSSHIGVLKNAKKLNLDYVVVLEDDAQFLDKNFINNQIKYAMHNLDFDVLMIAGNIRKIEEIDKNKPLKNFKRVKKAFAGTGYIVKKHYYNTLINNMKEGKQKYIEKIKKSNTDPKSMFALDVYWFSLQQKDKWYIIVPRTVTQKPYYSDIENKHVNYRNVMIDIYK